MLAKDDDAGAQIQHKEQDLLTKKKLDHLEAELDKEQQRDWFDPVEEDSNLIGGSQASQKASSIINLSNNVLKENTMKSFKEISLILTDNDLNRDNSRHQQYSLSSPRKPPSFAVAARESLVKRPSGDAQLEESKNKENSRSPQSPSRAVAGAPDRAADAAAKAEYVFDEEIKEEELEESDRDQDTAQIENGEEQQQAQGK